MGMFDFLKDVGTSLFGKGEEAEKIEEMLGQELGNKIRNLKAGVEDGIVTLKGVCDCLATREKAALLSGNVKGVQAVDVTNLELADTGEATLEISEDDDPASVASRELDETTESRFYEIRPGDTLSKIAKTFYGNAVKYPLIFEANREVIKHPDKIYPGQKIRIPKLAG